MGKRTTKSVKGEEVDFDLLETKQKMETNKPKVLEVKQREDFVHTKRRSRGRRSVMQKLRERRDNENAASGNSKQTKKSTSTSQSTDNKTESSKTSSPKKKRTRKVVKNQ